MSPDQAGHANTMVTAWVFDHGSHPGGQFGTTTGMSRVSSF
jgi:hypothetical protein